MPTIHFQDKDYTCTATESVLDALNRQGANLPFSCGAGHCHSCMARVVSGSLPKASQIGLRDTQKIQGYFLPCVCKTASDLHIQSIKVQQPHLASVILQKKMLNPNILRLRVEKPEGFTSFAGQSVQLAYQELEGHYPLASIDSDDFLELHIQRIADDMLSDWLFNQLDEGEIVLLSCAYGDCFYLPNSQPLLLAATGTGLAAIHAILRQAVEMKHPSPIKLFHAGESAHDCYDAETLRTISQQYADIDYYPCVIQPCDDPIFFNGTLYDAMAEHQADFQGWRALLYGNQEDLNQLRVHCLQQGIRNMDIYAESWTPSMLGKC